MMKAERRGVRKRKNIEGESGSGDLEELAKDTLAVSGIKLCQWGNPVAPRIKAVHDLCQATEYRDVMSFMIHN